MAAFDGAGIGSLAGMDATMPSQARRLPANQQARPANQEHGPYIRKRLITAKEFTFVRFLACVGPVVYRQGAALDEALPAILVLAYIWSFVGMDTMVSLEVRLSIEFLMD